MGKGVMPIHRGSTILSGRQQRQETIPLLSGLQIKLGLRQHIRNSFPLFESAAGKWHQPLPCDITNHYGYNFMEKTDGTKKLEV